MVGAHPVLNRHNLSTVQREHPKVSDPMRVFESVGVARLRQTIRWSTQSPSVVLAGLLSGLRETTETNTPENMAYERSWMVMDADDG